MNYAQASSANHVGLKPLANPPPLKLSFKTINKGGGEQKEDKG